MCSIWQDKTSKQYFQIEISYQIAPSCLIFLVLLFLLFCLNFHLQFYFDKIYSVLYILLSQNWNFKVSRRALHIQFLVSYVRILSCFSAFSSLFLKLSTGVILQNIVCPNVEYVPETRKLREGHNTKMFKSFQGFQQYH